MSTTRHRTGGSSSPVQERAKRVRTASPSPTRAASNSPGQASSRKSSVTSSTSGSSGTTMRSTKAKHHGMKIMDIEGVKEHLNKRVTAIAINFKKMEDREYKDNPVNIYKVPLLHWSFSAVFKNGSKDEAIVMEAVSPQRDDTPNSIKGKVSIRHVRYVVHRDVLNYPELQFVRRVVAPNVTVGTFINIIEDNGLFYFRPDKNGFGCLSWVDRMHQESSGLVENGSVKAFRDIITLLRTNYRSVFWVPHDNIYFRPVPDEDDEY